MAYLDSHGLNTLWTQMKAKFARKIGNTTGDDSVTIKLQNASGSDLDSGSTVIAGATTTAAGVMSKADKSKLDGIEAEANKYVHPTTAGNKHIPAGGASGNILTWAADGTAQWSSAPETGVTKVTAGSNVSVTPSTGTGEVTISATDTTYESKAAASGGTEVSLCTTGEKSTWNSKQDAITFNTAYSETTNKAATMTDIANAMTGAAKYQDTIATEAAFTALTNYKNGYYWFASASFVHTLSDSTTITVETGNMIIAKADYASAYSAVDFDIIQTDIEAIPDSVINALS